VNTEQHDLLESLRPARRVVIVDDHPSFRRCARTLLTAEGFEVVGEAEDGAGAIALVPELHPQLVLLDVQLPDIDGFEVAERLLALDGTLAIVLVSSRDRAQYGSLVEASGARGFVGKEQLSGWALERLLE
jgi:DNA-binding NarL/FixJ family response regulator